MQYQIEPVIGFSLFVFVFFIFPSYLIYEGAKDERKEEYSSLEVLKYSGDTIEVVFHNRNVKREFNRMWEKCNDGQRIYENPVSHNANVLKYNGDTIQIKFENAGFQRKFERQWRRYSDYKLNHINQNIKKR